MKLLTKKEKQFINNQIKDANIIKKNDKKIDFNKKLIEKLYEKNKEENNDDFEKEILIENKKIENEVEKNLSYETKLENELKNKLLTIMNMDDYEYIKSDNFFVSNSNKKNFILNIVKFKKYIKENYKKIKITDFIRIYKFFLKTQIDENYNFGKVDNKIKLMNERINEKMDKELLDKELMDRSLSDKDFMGNKKIDKRTKEYKRMYGNNREIKQTSNISSLFKPK